MTILSQLVHSMSYAVSYSVVLPTLFVAHSVPGLGPVADGLLDGIHAACHAVKARNSRRDTAAVTADVDERSTVLDEGLEAVATC
jgi:hypothetical protein